MNVPRPIPPSRRGIPAFSVLLIMAALAVIGAAMPMLNIQYTPSEAGRRIDIYLAGRLGAPDRAEHPRVSKAPCRPSRGARTSPPARPRATAISRSHSVRERTWKPPVSKSRRRSGISMASCRRKFPIPIFRSPPPAAANPDAGLYDQGRPALRTHRRPM